MRFSARYLLAILGVMLLLPAVASAQWTPAGTTITNKAFLDYKNASGSQSFPQDTAVATFTVQQRAAVNLVLGASTYTSGEGVSYNIPLTITNQGNGSDSFTLSATLPSGWTIKFYRDTVNANGLFDAAEEITSTDALAAGANAGNIKAWVTIPANAASSTGNNVVITATSNFDESTLGGGKTNQNVFDSKTQVVTVKTADVTISKSASPTNPAPGGTVTYTITYQNIGTGGVQNLFIYDTLSTNLTFVSASNGGSYDGPSRRITWNLGSLTPGDQAVKTVTFQATVGSLASGTVIGNWASAAYKDSTNGKTSENPRSNTQNVTVTAENWSLIVTPPVAGADSTGYQSVDVGTKAVYTLTLTNNGNTAAAPTFTVTQNSPSSGAALTWTYFLDANANGTYEAGTDVTTISSGGSLASIAAGNSRVIFAVSDVGLSPNDTSTHLVDYSFASTNASTIGSSTTTIKKPIMSIIKSVASLAANSTRQPGDVMEYTITVTNSGSGAASNVFVTDNIPTNTTFVSGSIDVDGTIDTGDTQLSGSTITVNLNTVAASSTHTIKFKVTIN